jgi:NADP-dependent 3-hydroxy acid dehydrogenase YdfG
LTLESYRTAVVTGASSGIGAATVRMLRALDVTVHALARDADRLAALAQETGCLPHAVDITDRTALAEQFGGMEVDILVNNAGQTRRGNLLDNSADDVDALIDVNLRGVLQLTRLVLPGMVARNLGHVVNISSVAGHHAFSTGNTTYHATKAAIHSLSQQLRCDLYGSRVRVTEISPARVETEIYARPLADGQEAHKRFFSDYEALLPEDIAAAIDFCLRAPARMDVSLMEIMPTMQVIGGWRFARKSGEGESDGGLQVNRL